MEDGNITLSNEYEWKCLGDYHKCVRGFAEISHIFENEWLPKYNKKTWPKRECYDLILNGDSYKNFATSVNAAINAKLEIDDFVSWSNHSFLGSMFMDRLYRPFSSESDLVSNIFSMLQYKTIGLKELFHPVFVRFEFGYNCYLRIKPISMIKGLILFYFFLNIKGRPWVIIANRRYKIWSGVRLAFFDPATRILGTTLKSEKELRHFGL